MSYRPPLHLHLLAHPQSQRANAVAEALRARFMGPPASGALRLPVYFTPDRGDDLPPPLDRADGLNLDAARHTLVVVLGDERMARRVNNGTGQAWQEFLAHLIGRTPVGTSPHHVLPVALDDGAFQLADRQHMLRVFADADPDEQDAKAIQAAEISLHVAARAIQLLDKGAVEMASPHQVKAPVRIFISHAKADLSEEKDDPAYQTMNALVDLPIEHWFDAAHISTGQQFDEAISTGVRDSTVMLAFCTDHYSSRPWCRHEIIEAKRAGAHILLVDALRGREARHFPYSGNVAMVRWQYADPKVDARAVIDQAVLEALRYRFNRAELEAVKDTDDIVLAGPPEAVTLAHQYPDVDQPRTLLYPDPPLGTEELLILGQLRPKGEFVTPLTRLGRRPRPGAAAVVATSISDSDDSQRYGLSLAHQETLADEIYLYLLVAGLRIAYGGALSGDMTRASNFTVNLFELARSYADSGLMRDDTGKSAPIINHIGWPLILGYGDREWALFGSVAIDRPYACPLTQDGETVFPPVSEGWRLKPDTPLKRYAWARGMSAMREGMLNETQARIVIGGRMSGFQGLLPGILEEAWLSIRHGRPLFLIGAFGGVARMVSDTLEGEDRPDLTEAHFRSIVSDYNAVIDYYMRDGVKFVGVDQIRQDLAAHTGSLSSALNNGLSDEQNRELIHCSEPRRIAELVLHGLSKINVSSQVC